MLKQRLLSLLIASAVTTSALAAPAATPAADPSTPAPAARPGADLASGLFAALVLWGLVSAIKSDSSGNDSPRETWRYRQRDGGTSSSPGARPDTSAGCAWGDRAYGTCH